MRRLRNFIARIEKFYAAIAALALFAMMLSISADATGRYLFDHPFEGNYELTGLYLMVIIVFLMLSPCYRDGGHIRIDFLAQNLERRFGDHYRRFIALLSLAGFLPLCWFSGDEAVEKIAALETSMGAISFPLYLSYVWVPLGALLLSCRLLLEVIQPEPGGGDDRPAEVPR